MPINEEAVEINREWRLDFRDRLEKLAEVVDEMRLTLNKIQMGAVDRQEVAEIRARIRVLEDFKLKTVTILIVVQAGLVAVGGIIIKVIFK